MICRKKRELAISWRLRVRGKSYAHYLVITATVTMVVVTATVTMVAVTATVTMVSVTATVTIVGLKVKIFQQWRTAPDTPFHIPKKLRRRHD